MRPGSAPELVKVAWKVPPSRTSPETSAGESVGVAARRPKILDVGVVDVFDANGAELLVERSHDAGGSHG